MVTLNAHFDGKVIVPDEPLDLPANQKLRISVEAVDAMESIDSSRKADLSRLFGLARATDQMPYDPAEEDALWEKRPLRRS